MMIKLNNDLRYENIVLYHVIMDYMDESFMLAFVRIPFELDCSDCFFFNVSGTEESENQAEEELIAFEGGASELNLRRYKVVLDHTSR